MGTKGNNTTQKKSEATTDSGTVEKKAHRKKKDWVFVKYFILKEILKKNSISVKELLVLVNKDLLDIGETHVKKSQIIQGLKKLQETFPFKLSDNNATIDLSDFVFTMLQNSKKDTCKQLEKIAQNSNDPSIQILKLLWSFNAGAYDDIFEKLSKLEDDRSQKLKLVNKVFDLLNHKNVHHVILSTGVTMFELGRQLIDRHNESKIQSIVSSNILILLEFLLSKIPTATLPLKMLPGLQFFRSATASLGPERYLTNDELNSDILKDVQASVLSFTSLSYDEGFKIGLDYPADIKEKITCLQPHVNVASVIITIDWEKILSNAPGTIVKDKNGRVSHELFDFSNDREYIIITDRPDKINSNVDKKRLGDLLKWASLKQVTVIDSDDNLKKYLKNSDQYSYI